MLNNKIYPMNLVIWHKLGVPYLLAEHNLKENICSEHQLFRPEPKKNYVQLPKFNTDANSAPNLTKKHYIETKPKEYIKGESHPSFKNNMSDSPEFSKIQAEAPAKQNGGEKASSNPKILPLHQWPKAWKDLLTNKNRAKVIWTYSGLEDDISGQGSAERKELVRKLIKELAFPSGTHAFWPITLPQNEDRELNSQIFWSSAQLLEARAIVIMGSTVLNAFNIPKKLRPLQQSMYGGYMIIVLPDINIILSEKNKYAPVREFVRAALKKYVQG